jgi:hypothetical protein
MIGIAKFRRPGIGGIFDFEAPPTPKFPPLDLPLDAGSLSPVDGGGADGGGEPAPAPSPGGDVPAADFPVFDFPVTVPTVPTVVPVPPVYNYPVTTEPVVVQQTAPAIPTWVIAGGAALAGLAIGTLLLGRKNK